MNTDEANLASGSGAGRPVTPPNIRFNYHEIRGIPPTPLEPTPRPPSTPPDVPGAHASNPETPTATAPATNEAFQIAIQAFINDRLPADVKKDFQSASEIMQTLQMMQAHRSRPGNTMHISSSVSDRVKKVLEGLRHFTGSVAICVQHSPEISSLVIGGVNCILVLALGYIEFLGALTEMLERIGGHIFYLSQYCNRTFQSSQKIQEALAKVYCGLLELCVETRRVLVDKEGKSSYMRGFKHFFRITWEPFEARFRSIEAGFIHHVDIVIRLANVEQQEANEMHRQILKWLSPDDYEEIHEGHYGRRCENTGQWLLDDHRFISWRDKTQSGLLWCHGIPGSGKTVLASLVIEHLSALYGLSKDTGLAFLYCTYKESRSPEDYIKLAMKQLCRRMPVLPPALEKIYQMHHKSNGQLSYVELGRVFSTIIQRFDSVFLILDALDECSLDQRTALCEFVLDITELKVTHEDSQGLAEPRGILKLFVTSRKEPDLEQAFLRNPTQTIIEIEPAKVNTDIEVFVKAQLQQRLQDGDLVLENMALKQKILTSLTTRAGGMFLWVKCQLDTLCAQVSDSAKKKALNRVPEHMYSTYERILNAIDKKPRVQRELARRVLIFLAYTRVPIPVNSLSCAVSVENCDESLEVLESSVPSEAEIVGACSNLISIDSNTQKVQPIHFSVRLFLTGCQSNSIETLEIGRELGHREMARMLMTFLSFLYSESLRDCTAISEYIEFSRFLSKKWPHHLLAANLHSLPTDHQMITSTSAFFEKSLPVFAMDTHPKFYFSFSPSTLALLFNLPGAHSRYQPQPLEKKTLVGVHGIDKSMVIFGDHFAMHYATNVLQSVPVAQRLYSHGHPINHSYAEQFPLGIFSMDSIDIDLTKLPAVCKRTPLCSVTNEKVAEFLLDNGAIVEPQIMDGNFVDPLVSLARLGNAGVMQLLLDRVVDKYGARRADALCAAADMGHVEAIRLLLDNGADINAQGRYESYDMELYGTALQAAAGGNEAEAMRLLLDKGADVNAQGGYYGNALQAAASLGEVEIIRFLLDKGADVNAQGGYYGNALQAAANNYYRRSEAIWLLLDHGADVNAQGGYYGSALQAAAAEFYSADVRSMRFLLEQGADVNAQGGYYGNALQAAASQGNVETMQLLLDHGANFNAQSGYYGNALQAAAHTQFGASVDSMCLLLDKGLDVNTQGGYYGNALQAATHGGQTEAMQFLVSHGADVHAQGGYYGNVVQAAASNGKVEIIRLLLDKGADVNAQGGYYGNALQAAAFNGHFGAMQLLLDEGADVNTQGGYYGNALQAAAFNGQIGAMQLLLDEGADANTQGGYYGNALQAAAFNGHSGAMQLLLDEGADVNTQGGYYGNALQAASYHCHPKSICLLVSKGADVNAQDGYFGNALQAAAYCGRIRIVFDLLKFGANVTAEGGYYGNALQAAAWRGKIDVIRLLLYKGADVNVQGGHYGSALQAALASSGELGANHASSTAKILQDRGADIIFSIFNRS